MTWDVRRRASGNFDGCYPRRSGLDRHRFTLLAQTRDVNRDCVLRLFDCLFDRIAKCEATWQGWNQ